MFTTPIVYPKIFDLAYHNIKLDYYQKCGTAIIQPALCADMQPDNYDGVVYATLTIDLSGFTFYYDNPSGNTIWFKPFGDDSDTWVSMSEALSTLFPDAGPISNVSIYSNGPGCICDGDDGGQHYVAIANLFSGRSDNITHLFVGSVTFFDTSPGEQAESIYLKGVHGTMILCQQPPS